MSGMLKSNYPSLSRREFLITAVGAGGAMLLGPAWLNAAGEGVDPRVAQVMSRTIGIDMHNHVWAHRRLCELCAGFRGK
jgi:membrane dipeptidase